MITLKHAILIKDAIGWDLYKECLRLALIDTAIDCLSAVNQKYSNIISDGEVECEIGLDLEGHFVVSVTFDPEQELTK